jgi:hypothetical protein
LINHLKYYDGIENFLRALGVGLPKHFSCEKLLKFIYLFFLFDKAKCRGPDPLKHSITRKGKNMKTNIK